MAAIIFVYLVMVALYNSYSRPFVVMFSIPVAIIGALTALALAKQTISIFSIIGMIMLVGLVAKNAILLVDFTNHLKEKGMPLIEALVAAGRERLRPILMTTLSMVFGMLPIALATGSASEMKNGMAWVIIGGLLDPCGYVIHGQPRTPGQHMLITFGPFFLNSILGFLIALPATLSHDINNMGVFSELFLYWLGISIAMHAFPSIGDAKSLWQGLWHGNYNFAIRLLALPSVGIIYLGALGSYFWLDAVYGVFIIGFLPGVLLHLFV